jgi:hypothetical protein
MYSENDQANEPLNKLTSYCATMIRDAKILLNYIRTLNQGLEQENSRRQIYVYQYRSTETSRDQTISVLYLDYTIWHLKEVWRQRKDCESLVVVINVQGMAKRTEYRIADQRTLQAAVEEIKGLYVMERIHNACIQIQEESHDSKSELNG